MRSVGLCSIMAQMGSFVPCSQATVCPFDKLLVRIGAGDSVESGVSTFYLEMSDIAYISRHATRKSLVLIDELGRGTSTYDGFGLAWSISLKLASHIKARSMFATHFHELTHLQKEIKSVRNVYFDGLMEDDQLILMYKIKEGVCFKSYGIQVAKLAGFPRQVVDNASQFLANIETGLTNLSKEDQETMSEILQRFQNGKEETLKQDVADLLEKYYQ